MVVVLEAIIVPFSVFLMVGYHLHLWYCLKKRTSQTTIGANVHSRLVWFVQIMEDVEKKGMFAVQTLRNIQMVTILNATFAIILNTALAALTNNSYNATHLFKSTTFSGSKSGRIFAMKYEVASFSLLLSLFYSSLALAFFMDANFLINASSPEFASFECSKTAFERGSLFALVGNRLLLLSIPLLLWAFGPLPVVLSSVALIWHLYELDFAKKDTKNPKEVCHD